MKILNNKLNNKSLKFKITFFNTLLLILILIIFNVVIYFCLKNFLIEESVKRLKAQVKPIISQWFYYKDNNLPPVYIRKNNDKNKYIEKKIYLNNKDNIVSRFEEYLHDIASDFSKDLTSKDTCAIIIDKNFKIIGIGKTIPDEPDPVKPDFSLVSKAFTGEKDIYYISKNYKNKSGDDINSKLSNEKSEKNIVILIPLRINPESNKIIGVIQLNKPLTEIGDILHFYYFIVVVLIIVLILIGTILNYFVVSFSFKDLNLLVKTCKAVSNGDVDKRVKVNGNNEISLVGKSLNNMLDKIDVMIKNQKRFFIKIAHELRTPLTTISGSLEILLRGGQDDPEILSRLLKNSYKEINRLSKLNEKLLAMLKIDISGGILKKKVKICDFFKEIEEQLYLISNNHHGKNNIVFFENINSMGDYKNYFINIDSDAIKEVIYNLIDNALKYSLKGQKIKSGWNVLNNKLNFWVLSYGPGIEKEDFNKIFDPFYRGRNVNFIKGTGLGLSIIKEIVKAHNGNIYVRSSIFRKGNNEKLTIFVIQIPMN